MKGRRAEISEGYLNKLLVVVADRSGGIILLVYYSILLLCDVMWRVGGGAEGMFGVYNNKC